LVDAMRPIRASRITAVLCVLVGCSGGQGTTSNLAEAGISDGGPGEVGLPGDAFADDGSRGSDAPRAPDVLTQDPCIEAGNCPPPVDCGALSTVAGKWQNISPPAFLTPVNLEIISVGVNPIDGTAFAAAGNVTNGSACPSGSTCPSGGTGIYKSTDCGSTWARVSSTAAGTDSAALLTGDPWAMLVDPVTPTTMYVNNGYGAPATIFKSINGGVDWTALNPDPTGVVGTPYPFVQAIAIDPFDHMHLAVTFHENCGGAYAPFCLSQSTDGGSTWHVFNGPTSIPNWTISGWMESASISILGASSYLVLTPAGIWYTKDGGGTWTQVLAQIVYSSYGGGTHIAPDGTLYVGATNVYSSAPNPATSPPFALGAGSTTLSMVANSPLASVLTDDGLYLYAASRATASGQVFWTAPLSNPTAWTPMPDAICASGVGAYDGQPCAGSNAVAYDPTHHIIYSASEHAGLWRLVTQ
jgi:hypothetical protein